MAYGDITSALLRLAARPAGVTTSHSEFADYTTVQVGNLANKLVAAGRLFRVKTGHKSVTFYANQADAERVQAGRLFRQQPPKPAPKAAGAAHFAGDMVITEKTKFTICPAWEPRFQATEILRVYGGNQRGRVLREAVVTAPVDGGQQ